MYGVSVKRSTYKLWGSLKGKFYLKKLLASNIQHLRKDTSLHIQNKAATKETKDEVQIGYVYVKSHRHRIKTLKDKDNEKILKWH